MVLLFDPRLTSAWLGDIDLDSRTVGIRLCLDHANRVTVPDGWTLTDDRSGSNRVPSRAKKRAPATGTDPTSGENEAPIRLATVTSMPEPRGTEPADEATIEVNGEPDETDEVDDAAGQAPDDDAPDVEDEAPDDDDDADVAEPTLWSEDQPESLRVDSSTPMLSRAFRAAHID